MEQNFTPTHKITVVRGDKTEVEYVMLDEGSAYTQAEWESATGADWTFDEDGLLFQGQVPIGESSIVPDGMTGLFDDETLTFTASSESILDEHGVLNEGDSSTEDLCDRLRAVGATDAAIDEFRCARESE